MLCEKVSIVEVAWKPLDKKFTEANAVTDPVVAHGDSFGLANSNTVTGDALSTFVVGDDCCGLLRVT